MKRLQIVAATSAALLLLLFIAVVIYRLTTSSSGVTEGQLAEPVSTTSIASQTTDANLTPATPPVDCPSSATDEYLTNIDTLMARWDDAIRLADSAARITLPPIVDNLQSIRRDFNALAPPACAQFVHELQSLSMHYAIEGFLAFMQQSSDLVIDRNFLVATNARASFNTHLAFFRADPLAAYTLVHTPVTIIDAYEPSDDWRDIRMIEDGPMMFSLPGDWTNPPADEYEKILIKDPSGTITLNILMGSRSAFLGNSSPPAALIRLQAALTLINSNQSGGYNGFGANNGNLITTKVADGSVTELGGALHTPDGTAFVFTANKQATPMTPEEENTIYMILASIRLFR